MFNTISGVVPWLVAQSAAKEGIDATRVLKSAGLDPQSPPAADQHVDITRYYDAWRFALERIRDPAFALRVAAASELEDSEVFGFLAISCETLAEAYTKTAAYRALYNAGARWELQVDADRSRLIWYPWPGDPSDPAFRAAMDFQVADMANAIFRLSARDPRPLEVRLAHAPPPDLAPWVAAFGVTPVFDAPLYELAYPSDIAAHPIRTFNSKLRDYFDAACRQVQDRMAPGPSVTAEVRTRLIHAMDGGDTSVEAVAKLLGMSARTLQRRLSDEGQRFNDVLDEVRTEFAKRYLARGSVSASEVAYLLGFAEPPAFFKAFKRWTGMTPGAFQAGRT